MSRLFDCFTFFNELDLLEIRLETLDPVVDFFVIAEAPITYRTDPKPFYLELNKQRFASIRAKSGARSSMAFRPKVAKFFSEDYQTDSSNAKVVNKAMASDRSLYNCIYNTLNIKFFSILISGIDAVAVA